MHSQARESDGRAIDRWKKLAKRARLAGLTVAVAAIASTSLGAIGASGMAMPADPPPTIEITPTSGAVGTTIDVTGTCEQTASDPMVSFSSTSGSQLYFAPGGSIGFVGPGQVAGHLLVPSKLLISPSDPSLSEPVGTGDVLGVVVDCSGQGNLSEPQLFTVTAGATTTVPSSVTTTAPATSEPATAPLTLSVTQVAPGGSITTSGDGFAPGTSLVAELHSAPVRLATFFADGDGAFTTTVKIPADTTLGAHQIVVTGTGPDGTRTLTADITVVAAPATTASPVSGAPNYTG